MSTITHERLLEVLSYDPVTGVFIWRVATSNRVKVGAVAGRRDVGGYVIIKVDSQDYKAHHLAWFYVHGEWPGELDHEDTNQANNAIGNLRPASRFQNSCNRGIQSNNTTGFKGVTFHTGRGKFQAYIKLNGKRRFLGSFDKAEEAAAAYDRAAITLHGAFMRPSAGVAA